MKRIMELKIKSPAAAAPVLTDANLPIRIIFLKEDPARIVDEGLIAETAYGTAKCKNIAIVNGQSERSSISPSRKTDHH